MTMRRKLIYMFCAVAVKFVEQYVVLNYVFIREVFMWKVSEKTQTYNEKWFVS